MKHGRRFLLRHLITFVSAFLLAGANPVVRADGWDDFGDAGRFLVNGNYYGQNPVWTVTLKAGTVGSLFGDTMGPVRTFRYETVVTVDGVEKLVIPGGTYTTTMSTSAYTVKIPLRQLGIFDTQTSQTHYLTAFTRNYEQGYEGDTGYSIITEDIYVQITYEEDPQIRITASDGEVEDGILVKWKANALVKDNAYVLYRAPAGGGQVCLGTFTSTSYFDDEAQPDLKYEYSVSASLQTENGYEEATSDPDEGIYGTKPELLGVKVAKLWLTGEGPYNVKLKWNEYNDEIYEVVKGNFKLEHQLDTRKMYSSSLTEIAESGKDKIVDISKGASPMASGNHGEYEMDVDWYYENVKSGRRFRRNYNDVSVKVYFDKYKRDDGNISNWFVNWKEDGAIPKKYFSDVKYDTNAVGNGYFDDVETARGAGLFDNLFHFYDGNGIEKGGCHPKVVFAKRHGGPDGWYLHQVGAFTARYVCSDNAAAVGDVFTSGNAKYPAYTGPNVGAQSRGVRKLADLIEHEMQHGECLSNLWQKGSWVLTRQREPGSVKLAETPYKLADYEGVEAKLDLVDMAIHHSFVSTFDELWHTKENMVIDSDGDGIADVDERAGRFGLWSDPGVADTYYFHTIPWRRGYARKGDNEVLARLAEFKTDVVADTSKDWAFPGTKIDSEYEGYVKVMNRALSSCNASEGQDYHGWEGPDGIKDDRKRVLWNDFGDEGQCETIALAASSAATTGKSSLAAGKSTFLQGSAALNAAGAIVSAEDEPAPCDFSVVETGVGAAVGGEGAYSSLVYPVTILNSTDADRTVIVRGYLSDADGKSVAYAWTQVDIAASSTSALELAFAGNLIYESRSSGYTLSGIVIEEADNDMPSSYATAVINVGADRVYEYSEFAPNDGYVFCETISEQAGEDGITVSMDVEINNSATLDLVAILKTSDGEYVAEARTNNLSWAGVKTVAVTFSREQLAYARCDGPYEVSLVQLLDGPQVVWGGRNVYATREYSSAQFEPEERLVVIDEVSFASVEGKADGATAFAFSVSNCAEEALEYNVRALLFGANETFSASLSASVALQPGGNNIEIAFDAKDIPDEPVGPYWVREIVLNPVDEAGTRAHFHPAYLPFEVDRTPAVAFAAASAGGVEGDAVTVSIAGGAKDAATSAMVHLAYNTASAADVDMSKGAVDGVVPRGGLKFPLKVTWEKGEIGEKAIAIPLKADSAIEGDEFFTLQLANATGMKLGKESVCTVAIADATRPTAAKAPQISKVLASSGIKLSVASGTWVALENGEDDSAFGMPYRLGIAQLSSADDAEILITGAKGRGTLHIRFRFAGDDDSLLCATDDALPFGASKWFYFASPEDDDVEKGWNELALPGRTDIAHKFSLSFQASTDGGGGVEFGDIYWEPSSKAVYTVQAASGEGGTASGSGAFAGGAKASLVATAKPGWEFAGWVDVDTGETVSMSAKYSHPVARDVSLVANFSRIPYIRGLADAIDAGKVTGSALCAYGKKTTLKATANKGYVFAGWCDENGDVLALTPSLVIDRSARPAASGKSSTVIVDVAGDATYHARFVTKEEDRDAISFSLDGVACVADAVQTWTNYVGVAVDWPLDAAALSAVSVKAAGLPSGLKLVADNTTGLHSVSGVPSSASKINTKTGDVSPSRVKFTVTTAGGNSQVYVIDMVVLPLPAWAQGTFTGCVSDADGAMGFATLAVAANGKVSGKISSGGVNWTLKAGSYLQAGCLPDAIATNFTLVATATAGKTAKEVALVVESMATGEGFAGAVASGTFGDGEATLWRGVWKDKATAAAAKTALADWQGVYTLSLESGEDYGSGYLSLTIGKDGNVKAAGKLADGTKVSASSPLLFDAGAGWLALFYVVPSSYKGGVFWIGVGFAGPKGELEPVFGPAQWTSRNPDATAEHGAGFARSPLFCGAYYDKLVDLRAYYSGLSFSLDCAPGLAYVRKWTHFDGSGRKTVENLPFVADPVAKDGALSLSFTQATGIFKGTWSFWYDYVSASDDATGRETLSHASRKVTFEGIAVLGVPSLRGWYLWNETGSYADPKTGKSKTYKYNLSFPALLEREQ